MARFKLRKALLHWRHRKLTLSFRSLVTMVFRSRIEEAKRLKDGSDRRIQSMDAEMARASADRQRAEMAKRKSDEMLTKELALKKGAPQIPYASPHMLAISLKPHQGAVTQGTWRMPPTARHAQSAACAQPGTRTQAHAMPLRASARGSCALGQGPLHGPASPSPSGAVLARHACTLWRMVVAARARFPPTRRCYCAESAWACAEGENDLKDAQRQLASDTSRSEAAQRRVASLQAEGAKETLGNKEKDELLAKLEELQQITAETDMLSLQLKRRVAS